MIQLSYQLGTGQQLQCAAQLAAYHSCHRGCVEVRFTMQLHTACGLMLQKL